MEQTENEFKKDYLREFERITRQMKRHKEKMEEIRFGKTFKSVIADGMPHSHRNADLSAYAAVLEAEERKYIKQRYQRIKKCKEITDKIERLENEDEKDVLTYRYIKLMKWEDICVKMKYSWQHIHRIHAKALENFKM